MLEDTIRVEGIMTLVKKSSRTAKEIGAGKDVAFETCLQAIIVEDSLEASMSTS